MGPIVNSKTSKFDNLIKGSICKYFLTILLFLIPIIIFLYLNIPLSESSVRGEHWALLARYVENVSLIDKIKNIALFAFPGIERPQYLAFFVPYIPYSIFGINFSGYAYFSYFLHILNGLLIITILRLLGGNLSNRFWAFSFFILSFICSDVINWTFFSYIQLNTLLILASICLFIKFEQTGQNKFFYIQSFCILIACFLYEISFTVFFIQILYLLAFKRNIKLLAVLFINIIIVILTVVLVHKGLPNEQDAINVFHLGIIYRSTIFIKNIFAGLLGFYPMSFAISNTVELNSRIEPPFLNTINIIIFISTIMLIPIVVVKLTQKILFDNHIQRIFSLIILILCVYIAGLCFARTPLKETYLSKSYFDGQFRYYYLPIALLCIVFFTCDLPKKRFSTIASMLVFGVMVSGNVLNTLRLNTSLFTYNQEAIKSIANTKALLQSENISFEPSNFIPLYFSLWKNRQFLVNSLTSDYIHNAASFFSKTNINSEFDSIDKIIELSKNAIKINPLAENAYYHLAVAYVILGRLEEAIEQYKKVISLVNDNSLLHYNTGLTYTKLGRLEQAIEEYKKAIILDPKHAVTYNNLGFAYTRLGRIEEAINEFQKAIRLRPDIADIYINLGISYAKLDRLDEAIHELQKAAILEPDDEGIHVNLGLIYEKKGLKEKSIKELKEAIRIKPEHIEARQALDRLYGPQ